MHKTDYMPIEGGELSQLQFLHSLYRVLNDDDSLKKRLGRIGIWWRYKGLVKQLEGVIGRAFATIEPETRRKIEYIWSRQELRVQNSGAPVDSTGDMLYVPKTAVIALCKHCQQESCGICMGNHNDRKDCQYRKGLLGMALPDLRREEKKSGKCVGKIFGWEE